MASWANSHSSSETGRRLGRWIRERVPAARAVIHTDSFDLIINLVSLGFGAAIVPIRALAIYGKRKPVTRLELKQPFTRKLVAVARRDAGRPDHLRKFVENILF